MRRDQEPDSYQPPQTDVRATACAPSGRFVALLEDGVYCFRGIRYAKSPSGALRWKAPVPCEPATEPIHCFSYGLASIQPNNPHESVSHLPQGEDCLSLNVFTASLDGSKPVMVWIHGGEGLWGSTMEPIYHGDNLARRRPDVVVVTINYRLGLLGRLDLGRFGAEYDNAGNQSLLDQIAALQWVQENIAAFGGDPENVTIFGESEGGASVAHLLVSDLAVGLFHKGIIQSGAQGYALTNATDGTASADLTDRFIRESGVGAAADLAALTEAQAAQLVHDIPEADAITRDGKIVPRDPWQSLASGECSVRVPLMIGTTRDEEKLYGIPEFGYDTFARIKRESWERGKLVSWGHETAQLSGDQMAVVESFMATRPEGEPLAERLSAFVTAYTERLPALRIAELHSRYAPTYVYRWDVPSAFPGMDACHAVEIAYVLYNLEATDMTGAFASAEIADPAVDAWANFAVTGDPSSAAADWPQYSAERRDSIRFTSNGPVLESDLDQALLELLEPHFVAYPADGGGLAPRATN